MHDAHDLTETAGVLEAARATLKAALREEGEALVSACYAVKASGAGSTEAARALRSADAAHARSNIASGELRALNAQADLARDDRPWASFSGSRRSAPDVFGGRATPIHRDAS